LCAFSNSARELLGVASRSWPSSENHIHTHIIAGASVLIWIWTDAASIYCIFFYSGKKCHHFSIELGSDAMDRR
jgi:hypothetical protein